MIVSTHNRRNTAMATNHQIITDIKHHGIITASAIHNIGIANP
jgi:hypothetical protein